MRNCICWASADPNDQSKNEPAATSQPASQAHGDREKFRQNAAPAGKIPKSQEDLPGSRIPRFFRLNKPPVKF
jgi:hypothetical protein